MGINFHSHLRTPPHHTATCSISSLQRDRHVVVYEYESRGVGVCGLRAQKRKGPAPAARQVTHLRDEQHEDSHAHTRHYVGMVLNDELGAEHWRPVALVSAVSDTLHLLTPIPTGADYLSARSPAHPEHHE